MRLVDGVTPLPGELLVSVDGELAWPAQVDLTDRWNGWLSPRFRPSVARALARWQTDWTSRREAERDDFQQDQLVLSPDGRTLVHLVWDEDAFDRILPPTGGRVHGSPAVDVSDWPIRWLTTREHAVWCVYSLVSASDEPDPPDVRVAVGARHWCWFLDLT